MQQLSITSPSSTIHLAFVIPTSGQVLHFPSHYLTGWFLWRCLVIFLKRGVFVSDVSVFDGIKFVNRFELRLWLQFQAETDFPVSRKLAQCPLVSQKHSKLVISRKKAMTSFNHSPLTDNSRLKINPQPSISWESVPTFTNWFTIFHLLSVYLLFIRLVDRLLPTSVPLYKPPTDFSIDAAHEMALFMWNIDKNLILKTVPYFCSRYGSNCAIYARDESIFCVRQWKKV